jgi:hypothetical protein
MDFLVSLLVVNLGTATAGLAAAAADSDTDSTSALSCTWAGPEWTAPTEEELAEASLDCDAVYRPAATDGSSGSLPGGGAAPDSVGEYFDPFIKIPCWNALDAVCSSAYRIPVGTGYGVVSGGGSQTWMTEAWHDGNTGHCDLSADLGAADRSKDLVVYLMNVGMFDSAPNSSSCLLARIEVTEYNASACTGTVTRGPLTDSVHYATTAAGHEHAIAFCDDKSDCGGSWGDTCNSDWHLPDVLFSSATNPTSVSRWYKTEVWTRICNADCSTGCSYWGSSQGCFRLNWN